MAVKIHSGIYKHNEALFLETDILRICVLPWAGSKIQSIYNKQTRREFLYQNSSSEYKKSSYDSDYGEGDMSGFDELFPSVLECIYPARPWKGIAVPDHGEVWALPWDYEIIDEMLELRVHGIRFPYQITKKIIFEKENRFTIEYNLENPSSFDFHFIWGPHIILNQTDDSKIILPPSANKIMSVVSIPNRLGTFGELHNWPITSSGGEKYDISSALPYYPDKCEKFYVTDKINEGWCGLEYTQTGDFFALSYSIDKVPYLGVWEGVLDNQSVCALEPCTGDLDTIENAFRTRRISTVKGGSNFQWHLDIAIENPRHIVKP